MSKFPAIPDFSDLQSAMTALRAIKDTVEQLAGLRQGASLGAPSVYVQPNAPVPGRGIVLTKGDFWIDETGPYLSFWTGAAWQRITT